MRMKFSALTLAAALAVIPMAAMAQSGDNTVKMSTTGTSPSATSLAVSPSSVDRGTTVMMHAVVEPTQGGSAPTGTVSFFVYAYCIGTVDVSNYSAVLNLDSWEFAPGKYPITAKYSGDKQYQPSSSPAETMNITGSTNSQTSLAVSPGSVESGSKVTLTADVQPTQGGPSATGTVLFFVDNWYMGSAKLKNTVAAISVSSNGMKTGKHTVWAWYLGCVDSNYLPSYSPTESFTVTAK
jgi:hypothetical protein